MSWNDARKPESSRFDSNLPPGVAQNFDRKAFPLDSVLSRKLAAMRWLAIILVVWIHAFNSYPRYLLPDSRSRETLSLYSYIEYLFSNGVARFVMPLLFAQSGFLFFFKLHATAGLQEKIAKRFKTLMAPYVIWNCIGIAVVVAARNVTSLQVFMPQYLRDMTWSQFGHDFLLHPVSFQLWYLRDLFVIALLSPLIYLICRNRATAIMWLLALLVAWCLENEPQPLLTAEGLLFFSLGSILALHRLRPQRPPRIAIWLFVSAVWLAMNAIRALIAFDPSPMAPACIFGLYKAANLLGLWVVWFAYDILVGDVSEHSPWWPWLTVSFYVFAAHQPLYNVVSDNVLARIGHHAALHSENPGGALLVYLFFPILTIATLSLLGRVIQSSAPPLHRVLTGGR